MENINQLLDKYFAGETTLEQENLLKKYFTSGEIHKDHLAYKPLFDVFEAEAKVTFPKTKKKQSQHKRFHLRTFLYTSSGVAAAILLAFWLFGSPAMLGDYAIVNGTRINDHEIAQQIAESKLNKVAEMLDGKLKPLESINKVKYSLEPAKKFTDVKNEINSIKQKLTQE
jgi:hypothetical protein